MVVAQAVAASARTSPGLLAACSAPPGAVAAVATAAVAATVAAATARGSMSKSAEGSVEAFRGYV